jgi:hypothetical protein
MASAKAWYDTSASGFDQGTAGIMLCLQLFRLGELLKAPGMAAGSVNTAFAFITAECTI